VRTSSKFPLSTFKNCWDRLRSLPLSEVRFFASFATYTLIRTSHTQRADQSNGNFFIISPSREKLSLRGLRAHLPRLERLAEYYFRISIRTFNSNDRFTLVPVSTAFKQSFKPYLSPSLLFFYWFPATPHAPLSFPLSPLKCGPNIFSNVFYHSTFWVSASPLYTAVLRRIHSNQYLIQCQPPFLLPRFPHGLTLVSLAFTEISIVSCATYSWIAFSVK